MTRVRAKSTSRRRLASFVWLAALFSHLGHAQAPTPATPATQLVQIEKTRDTLQRVWRFVNYPDVIWSQTARVNVPESLFQPPEEFEPNAPSAGAVPTMPARPSADPLLNSTDAGTRSQAIASLNLADAGAIERVVAALADPASTVRSTAQKALEDADPGVIRDHVIAGILSGNASLQSGLQEVLPQLRSTLQPLFLDTLRAPNEPGMRRAAAAYCLGMMGGREAAPALLETARARDPQISLASANALYSLSDPDSVTGVAELMSSPKREIKWVAVQTLGRIGGRKAVDALGQALLRERDRRLRVEIVALLGASNDEGAVPYLLRIMKTPQMREATGNSLRQLTGQHIRDVPAEWEQWYQQTEHSGQFTADSVPPPIAPPPAGVVLPAIPEGFVPGSYIVEKPAEPETMN